MHSGGSAHLILVAFSSTERDGEGMCPAQGGEVNRQTSQQLETDLIYLCMYCTLRAGITGNGSNLAIIRAITECWEHSSQERVWGRDTVCSYL